MMIQMDDFAVNLDRSSVTCTGLKLFVAQDDGGVDFSSISSLRNLQIDSKRPCKAYNVLYCLWWPSFFWPFLQDQEIFLGHLVIFNNVSTRL